MQGSQGRWRGLDSRTRKRLLLGRWSPVPCSRRANETADLPRAFFMLTRNCLTCGSEFHPTTQQISMGYGKYCKASCQHESMRGMTHPGRPKAPIDVLFWRHVLKSEACWIWNGHCVGGYGTLARRIDGKIKTLLAHRISWELHNGPIPEKLLVLHHCDNPPCVRPDHLFLGDDAANHADMVSKNRQAKWNGVTGAKLDIPRVLAIRHLKHNGYTAAELSRPFGVSHAAITKIIRGISWKNI